MVECAGLENRYHPQATNAPTDTYKSDAENLACFLAHFDPEKTGLAVVVKAWKGLPADVRKMIAGVVKLTTKGSTR